MRNLVHFPVGQDPRTQSLQKKHIPHARSVVVSVGCGVHIVEPFLDSLIVTASNQVDKIHPGLNSFKLFLEASGVSLCCGVDVCGQMWSTHRVNKLCGNGVFDVVFSLPMAWICISTLTHCLHPNMYTLFQIARPGRSM